MDEGVAARGALGVTGISYGGGSSLQLAYLRNRIRQTDGSLATWRSPAGRRLAIAAVYARWPWSDLGTALLRNGRARQNGVGGAGLSISPLGVPIQSFIAGLFLLSGRLSPPGVDPSSDVTTWRKVFDGPQSFGTQALDIVRELTKYHSAAGLLGSQPKPAPLLLESGFTDDLFPPIQSLRVYNDIRRKRGAKGAWRCSSAIAGTCARPKRPTPCASTTSKR